MADDSHDVRKAMLNVAAALLTGGPTTQFGHKYSGEEAVQKGYDLVAAVQMLDRAFLKK